MNVIPEELADLLARRPLQPSEVLFEERKSGVVIMSAEREWGSRMYQVTDASETQVAFLMAAAGKHTEEDHLPVLRARVILGKETIEHVLDAYDEDLGYEKVIEEERWVDHIFPRGFVKKVTSTGPVYFSVLFFV
mgnify:CR=1 FL=1